MSTIRVEFIDVGAGHRSWSADLPRPLTYHSLYNSVKRNHALGSRDIDFAENGGIYVGGFRKVGSWRIAEVPLPAPAEARS